MATYVVSDIHGEYDMFIALLDKIHFSDADTLYVLGDVVDRGPNPIKTLLKLMEMPNAICIVGNHELMALECLKFLNTTITDESVDSINEDIMGKLADWQFNGSESTINEFRSLDPATRRDVLDFILDFSMYEETTVGDNNFLMVHAGLGGYSPEKAIDDYSLKELVWDRADYDICYFPDTYVITGHTPTQYIPDNPKPGYIFKKNNHIAIDCGCCSPNGRLAAICLDTLEEIYIERP